MWDPSSPYAPTPSELAIYRLKVEREQSRQAQEPKLHPQNYIGPRLRVLQLSPCGEIGRPVMAPPQSLLRKNADGSPKFVLRHHAFSPKETDEEEYYTGKVEVGRWW